MKKISYNNFLEKILEITKENYKLIHSTNTYYSTENFKEINLLSIRPLEPIKIFFFPFKELLSENSYITNEILLLGIKSCDIKALEVIDKIFISDYKDNFYYTRREKTLIISSDCLEPKKFCFCSIIGGKPYVENISDLNISFIDEKTLILESFSLKGEKFLKKYFGNFEDVSQNDVEKRDFLRSLSTKKILELNNDFLKEDKKEKYYKTLKNTYELDEVWKEESTKCVQCGGCNFICPSCYCFLIREASKSYIQQYRDRVWDVCHFTGYARVAGGANPRKYKYQRFRNRYQCKFVYRYENFGFYACTGCGRCIEVCPAKIDIRKVIRSLVLAKGEQLLV